MPPTKFQLMSAGQELLTAVRLTSSGLGQLKELDDLTSDFFYLPMLSLQAGLERWLKITLCFHHLSTSGNFPSSAFFPRSKSGHDLVPLLKKVATQCYSAEFLSKFDYTKEDAIFLSSDQLIRFATMLSTFGQTTRYYHLNVVLGEIPPHQSPEMAWDDLVGSVMDDYPELRAKFFESGFSIEHLMTAIRFSRSIIARLGRSLARLTTLGALGREAERHTGYVWKFLQLSDEDIFNKDFPSFAKDF